MDVDLRNPLTEEGEEKSLLCLMTKDLNTAQEYWPEATEADLGDLKMYWDPENPKEVAVAKAAFDAARKKRPPIPFFRLETKDAKDGTQIDTWEEATKGATRKTPKRVQGVLPTSGG